MHLSGASFYVSRSSSRKYQEQDMIPLAFSMLLPAQ